VYRPATPPKYVNNDPDLNVAASRPASRPTSRPTGFGARNGGRYDTNSYILAYPEMAKAYGVAT
jgi:hypothetical protein